MHFYASKEKTISKQITQVTIRAKPIDRVELKKAMKMLILHIVES